MYQKWCEGYFHHVTLADEGLRFQVGHSSGGSCPIARPAHKNFMVLHTNGIHFVKVDFCGCLGSAPDWKQLMDVGWVPATPLEPQTCGTTACLRQFHHLNLQGRISPYDYYTALELMTDPYGFLDLPVRFISFHSYPCTAHPITLQNRLSSFMLLVREWRHIKMGKRAGRGHDPTGLAGTQRGGLAVPCRACPLPGVNLPDGWEDAPAEIKSVHHPSFHPFY